MAFRVKDANKAFALASSAAPNRSRPARPRRVEIPAIEGIGGSYLYLVDRYGAAQIYDIDFEPVPGARRRRHRSACTRSTTSPTM